MSPGLTKGERPSWSSPAGRAGEKVMEHVADSASARRAKASKRKKPRATGSRSRR